MKNNRYSLRHTQHGLEIRVNNDGVEHWENVTLSVLEDKLSNMHFKLEELQDTIKVLSRPIELKVPVVYTHTTSNLSGHLRYLDIRIINGVECARNWLHGKWSNCTITDREAIKEGMLDA